MVNISIIVGLVIICVVVRVIILSILLFSVLSMVSVDLSVGDSNKLFKLGTNNSKWGGLIGLAGILQFRKYTGLFRVCAWELTSSSLPPITFARLCV
tara:strand:+ start:206 stop:496 length:291 start_codon:yes stop_codon:yes gene_type:complete